MKSRTDGQVRGPGAHDPGPLLAGRDPWTVRRWIVAWCEDGDQFALAGPLDFAVGLGNALFRMREPDGPDGEFQGGVQVALWPGTVGTPAGIYEMARETLQRWLRSEVEYSGWSVRLDRAGFDLPDLFELLELSERTKSRRAS